MDRLFNNDNNNSLVDMAGSKLKFEFVEKMTTPKLKSFRKKIVKRMFVLMKLVDYIDIVLEKRRKK